MRAFFKSLVFNIAFFTYCFLASVFFVWTFALPRKQAMQAILYYFRGVAVVEKLFLGLDYRVTGRENLPPKGTPYILAIKHYSAYETLKVPVVFGDIAIILKKELTFIPLWGWYTIKTGMIPVDRGGGSKAIASLIKGARRVMAEGRPILIFPQGTRVRADETTTDKPYKVGIAKIAQTLNLPIVPVAINSAAFWPKHSFFKKAGIVDFKILPPIPQGLPPTETLKQLEAALEPACAALMAKAKIDHGYKKSYWPRGVLPLLRWGLRFFIIWAVWWNALAFALNQGIERALLPREDGTSLPISSPHKPEISGFPFALHLTWPDVTIKAANRIIDAPVLEASVIPLPAMGGWIAVPKGAVIQREGMDDITIDRAQLGFMLPVVWKPVDAWALQLSSVSAAYRETTVDGSGAIDLPLKGQGGVITGEMQMTVRGYKALIDTLVERKIVDGDKARIANGFFDAMATAQGNTGAIAFPLKVVNNVVYAGFVRLFEITTAPLPNVPHGMPPQRIRSDGSVTNAPPAPMPQMQPPMPQP